MWYAIVIRDPRVEGPRSTRVRLWDVARGTQRTDAIIGERRFAPDGRHVATDRQIFDVADGRMVWSSGAVFTK